MFLQNWKLSLIAIILIPIASTAARSLGKRMGKVTTQAQEKSSFLTKYLVELFKNHRLTKIFQKEKYERNRADNYLDQLKEKNKKVTCVVCLKDFDGYDFNCKKLKCGHNFHMKCIDEWLTHSKSCPICRKEIDIVF